MDGTHPKTIITGGEYEIITLDDSKSTLYLSDLSSIWSLDYEGNNLQLLLNVHQGVMGIGVFENRLFWSAVDGKLRSCDLTTVDLCQKSTRILEAAGLSNPSS